MAAVRLPTESVRWSEQRILEVARQRTHDLRTAESIRLTTMLAALMQEAGWEDSEFTDALCRDIMEKRG
jgi:hypothetical protein